MKINQETNKEKECEIFSAPARIYLSYVNDKFKFHIDFAERKMHIYDWKFYENPALCFLTLCEYIQRKRKKEV